MSRDSELYLRDILQAIENIMRFTADLDLNLFATDTLRLHSTLYNLTSAPEVPWRDIQRFRDKLAHHYFKIRSDFVWEIIQNDLPILKAATQMILNTLDDN